MGVGDERGFPASGFFLEPFPEARLKTLDQGADILVYVCRFFFVLQRFFFVMKHGSQKNVPSQNIFGGPRRIFEFTPLKLVCVIP